MKKKFFYSLGIMSGTSLDGLDFSLIKSDGEKEIKILNNQFFKFTDSIKNKIYEVIEKLNLENQRNLKNFFYNEINTFFSNIVIENIHSFFKKNTFTLNSLDIIGLHGNTVYHNPKKKISLQLGNYKLLADELQKPVICYFRDNDIKLGGQGAPLVPVYHEAIFKKINKTILVVNIGGISNFTYLSRKKILASDIGPGNVLIDKFCKIFFNKEFDRNGSFANKGKVIPEIINKWSKKKFLKKPPPKSFDNFFFKLDDYVQQNEYSKFDLIRSLTFFTALMIKNIQDFLPGKIDKWVICGGGSKNYTLISDLKNILKSENIFTSEELGFDSMFIESQAFAYIAIRTLKNLPSSFPNTTGVSKDTICGKIINPS